MMSWDCAKCGIAVDYHGNPVTGDEREPLCYDCAISMCGEVCTICGKSVDSDGYCPTSRAKFRAALDEFGDEDTAYVIADEWDWWHRHPNADQWTQQ